MKFLIPKLLLFAGILSTLALTFPRFNSAAETDSASQEALIEPEEIATNGKKVLAANLPDIFTKSSWKQNNLADLFSAKVDNALKEQEGLFKYRSKKSNYQIGNLNISREELQRTVEFLNVASENPEVDPSDIFDIYQIKGRDDKGSVHFTGYYTPVIKVSKEKNALYKYPFYRKPKSVDGKYPSREEIDGKGLLKDQGLEIAYAANAVDVYFMQVQGSGFIEYPDGTQSLLSYGGSNKKSYRSIGRYLLAKNYTTKDKVSINSIKKFLRENPDKMDEVLFSNPSYVFFSEGQAEVKGTGVTPLTPGHSIAVDPKYIPLGSTLLAKLPIADNKGNFIRHEYRILFAQDTGGAINGAGHVDLYTGVGRTAKRIACNTHHYGELWIILPKPLETRI